MKCNEVHLAIGAEPQRSSPELEQHLRVCQACADYRREMLDLDEEIRRVMNVDIAALTSTTLKTDAATRPAVRLVSTAPPVSAPEARVAPMARQWALAASVLFGVAVALILWGALPRHSLAADVVAHVISEPVPAVEKPLSNTALAAVLRNAHFQLDPIEQDVLFAQTCFFRGRLVPHFVLRSGDAAVTVLLLPNERLKAPEHFRESGYSGVLLPNDGHGSIAVLSRNDADSEREAREILSALHSQPAA